jgi:hypothetical protein
VCVDFHLLTSCAARDVILDKNCYTWPPIIVLYKFESLELAGMTRRKSIVVTFYDPFT